MKKRLQLILFIFNNKQVVIRNYVLNFLKVYKLLNFVCLILLYNSKIILNMLECIVSVWMACDVVYNCQLAINILFIFSTSIPRKLKCFLFINICFCIIYTYIKLLMYYKLKTYKKFTCVKHSMSSLCILFDVLANYA